MAATVAGNNQRPDKGVLCRPIGPITLLDLIAANEIDHPCNNECNGSDNVRDDDLANGLIVTANRPRNSDEGHNAD